LEKESIRRPTNVRNSKLVGTLSISPVLSGSTALCAEVACLFSGIPLILFTWRLNCAFAVRLLLPVLCDSLPDREHKRGDLLCCQTAVVLLRRFRKANHACLKQRHSTKECSFFLPLLGLCG